MDTGIVDKDEKIIARCAALGLSRPQAQALAEAGPFPSNLLYVLGLHSDTLASLPPKNWLGLAGQTASVSYKGTLTPESLLGVLVTGQVPVLFAAHISCFLEEAPMRIVVLAIEQAAQQSGMPISEIWANVRALGGQRLAQAMYAPIQIRS